MPPVFRTASKIPIAYFVSYVNLCEGHVPSGQNTVEMSLVDDGSTGKFVYKQSDIDAIPAGTPLPNCSNALPEALQWAANSAIDRSSTLGCNCASGSSASGCTNLEQACGNTLFPTGPGCG